jgi:hypothetical protein
MSGGASKLEPSAIGDIKGEIADTEDSEGEEILMRGLDEFDIGEVMIVRHGCGSSVFNLRLSLASVVV